MAPLGTRDLCCSLSNELPFCLGNALVLVDLGLALLLLVWLIFLHAQILLSLVERFVLLALAATGRSCGLDRAFQNSILLMGGLGLDAIHFGQNRLGASIIPQILVVVQDL